MLSSANEQSPSVGLIIAAYNAEATIGRALDSALAQVVPFEQIVVVDDGSTDNTAEIVNRYVASSSVVQLIVQFNQGPAAARNRAAEVLTTEWLAYLDADDSLVPEYLNKMLDFTRSNSGYDIYVTNAVRVSPTGKETLYRHISHPIQITFEEMAQGSQILGGGALLRRSDFESFGGFDENRRTAQDYDLWMRMLAADKKFIMNSDPLYRYYNQLDSVCSNPMRNLQNTAEILEQLLESEALSEDRRLLVEQIVGDKQARIRQALPLERLRTLIEPVGGEFTNRLFFRAYSSAAQLKKSLGSRGGDK